MKYIVQYALPYEHRVTVTFWLWLMHNQLRIR
jgi:hypothetical protein